MTGTVHVCFCKDSSHATNLPNIVVDGKPINRVSQAKVLGVILSSDLTWNVLFLRLVKDCIMLYQLKRAGGQVRSGSMRPGVGGK